MSSNNNIINIQGVSNTDSAAPVVPVFNAMNNKNHMFIQELYLKEHNNATLSYVGVDVAENTKKYIVLRPSRKSAYNPAFD
jgi:hypothetical protein